MIIKVWRVGRQKHSAFPPPVVISLPQEVPWPGLYPPPRLRGSQHAAGSHEQTALLSVTVRVPRAGPVFGLIRATSRYLTSAITALSADLPLPPGHAPAAQDDDKAQAAHL